MLDGTDQTIRLRDGRRLGYAEWGDPGGRPLLYFHGWPGARVEGSLADEAAKARGVRLIAVDRPGMGLSDFQPRRTLVAWPDDDDGATRPRSSPGGSPPSGSPDRAWGVRDGSGVPQGAALPPHRSPGASGGTTAPRHSSPR
jgi:pimeloyl-ACP methyl ester carboxylesterase